MDVSGNNNLVIIPQNLLNKMVNDPQMMKSVEYAIKSDIKAYKDGESFRQITRTKSTSGPLTFNEDGNYEKSFMAVTDSDDFDSSSKKLGQEESSEKNQLINILIKLHLLLVKWRNLKFQIQN